VVRAIDMTDPTRSARGRVEVEVVEELPEGTDDGGCCDAGNGPDGRAAPALLVLGALLLRRRRRILAA
jgi:MYXO-CTERM domain-containing protein